MIITSIGPPKRESAVTGISDHVTRISSGAPCGTHLGFVRPFPNFHSLVLHLKVGIFLAIGFLQSQKAHFSLQMYASAAVRARLATVAARRGFSTTRAQLGSPYHYAEGPRSNIPFNPLTKHFFWRYWAFMCWWAAIPEHETSGLTGRTIRYRFRFALRHCG